MLLGRDTELIVKSMVPNFLHIVPVGDNAVLDWLFHAENTALLLCLATNVDLLLVEADHDAGDLWPSYNGAED